MRNWSLFALLAVAMGIVLALMQLHPPKQISMAAGPENGAYRQVAERYRDILARDNITLKIVETAGSVDNARLLESGQVEAAILQGGIRVSDPEIEAIGAIFFEPLIFLVNSGATIPGNPAMWSGLRISSGQAGSGAAAAFGDFQAAIGLSEEANTHLSLSYGEAVDALAKGQIDIAVFVAPIDAPYLIEAYSLPSTRLLSLDYNDAISRRLEYAAIVTVPAGAISLSPVVPRAPRTLIALEARLAITPQLHPALVNRLTMAAKELHSARDLITDPETFPSVEGTTLRVNNTARQLILDGPSTWHDWLPFWMAAQINRMLLLLLPIVFILLPLLRAIPAIYAYFMGWRVWQYYPEIRSIEEELNNVQDETKLMQLDARLVELDNRLLQLRLPPAYKRASYEARIHIELVRKRILDLNQTAA